jgi:hypothetical protein
VTFDDIAWGSGSPYVRISVGAVKDPIVLSGWSIENEVGERGEIGLGVTEFNIGKVGRPKPIVVGTSTSLTLSFMPSPIGVSFQEHRCSAYLRGTTPFQPPLETRCPSLEEDPRWKNLDKTCQLLTQSLPRCEVISPEHLGDVSSSCESFLRAIPTFSTCVDAVGTQAFLPSWRIFVPEHTGFVHQEGGVLRLLDDRGLLVDTLPYETIGLK